jgi:signal transduction histidine kinase
MMPPIASPISELLAVRPANAPPVASERVRAERAEQQLRKMQSLLDMAAQMGRLGAWDYDVGQPCVTWSIEVCAIHDVPAGCRPTPEEAIAFFAPEYRESMSAVISKCLVDGSPFDVEGEIVTARGKRVWIRSIGEAEWDAQGRVRRLQGAIQDISESKRSAERELRMAEQLAAALEQRVSERTAQLEAANKELEAFSYSIAHDLRAPLSSIDGFSQMLEHAAGKEIPDRCNHYLKRIRAGIRQMSELTDGLLTLASLARTDLQTERVDLAALANAALASCRESAPDREVAVTVAPAMPADGDPRLLSQVVGNLVGNAWKFTSRTPDARIEVGVLEDRAGKPVYFVRDNGAGFDMAYASKMFEAFHRMHASSDFEGMGIGLAIVRKVVSRHGGRVWAESAPGRGASFHFTLGAARVQV